MKLRHEHAENDPETNASEQEISAENGTPSEGNDPIKEELEKLREDHEELQNQLLRTVADMQNMRKRFQQEAQQTRAFATEDLVRELLPVLDSFERTIESAEQGATLESVKEGIKAVDRQIRSALERRGVVRVKAQGQPFDPDVHEAIVTEETDEHPEGTVTLELEAGYKIADKVIRPARVRVSKKP